MEDEIERPIIRKLYRQSSLETRLSPSIPPGSDSEDEDDNAQSVRKHQTQEPSPQDKSAKNPINELRNRFENVGLIKLTPDTKPGDTSKENSKSDNEESGPRVTSKEQKTPLAPHQQLGRMNSSVLKELRGRHVATTSDNESKPKVVGEQKKKPPPPIRSVVSQTAKSSSSPTASVNPGSDVSEKHIETTNPSAMLIAELRGHQKESPSTNEPSTDAELSIVPKIVPEPYYETIGNIDASEECQKCEDKSDATDSASKIKAVRPAHAPLPVMASPRPKSPRPVPVSAKKDEKEESFWEKIGTLGRKKRIKEVQEVQEEGKYAIDSPGLAANPDMPPEDYTLDENEERSMMEPRSLEDPKLQELIYVLIEWINDELADQRIIVKDIAEDLYDGQVLQKLLERLTGEKLDVPEVTQSEEGQKQKLAVVLTAANRVLNRYPAYKWSVDSVHSKNIVSILHLLVGLARQFRAPVRLPERVAIQVVVVRKKDGQLIHRTVREEITSTYEDLGMRCERDAFDTLFDHAPEKLAVVKKSLVTFVNKHLSKVHLEVTELDTQFHDGVFLTLLLGLLEGFFVPLGSFHLTPKTHDQKVHNVSFAFDLMQEIGLVKPKARPEDIVNLDLKSTLRVLYNLFTKYKGMN